jgi:nitrogen regulatory protein PII
VKRVEAVVRVERLHKVREGLKELGLGGIILHADGWSKESKFHLRY